MDSQMNQGTKCICILPFQEPLLTEDPLTANLKPAEPNKPVAKRGLVVEDQPIAAMAAKILLTQQGCEIDIAENGATALTQVKQQVYDFILMDIGLPDISGYEVTKTIRQQGASSNHRTVIIGLTGHADVETKQLGLDAGMDLVLTKPLTQEVATHFLKKV